MSNTIAISVILPVYNVEPYIEQCLESLINQTLRNLEIILVNDCSTDRSGIICDEYAAKDPRITVLHNKENIKQGLSRNKGIDIAKGEYLCFIDPDDWVDLDYFEKLYGTAKQKQCDIVKGVRVKVFQDNSQEEERQLNIKIKDGLKDRKPLFLLFRYQHQTAIFKSDLFIDQNVRYPDLPNSQDVIFLLRITSRAKTFELLPDCRYYYRQYSLSTVHQKTRRYYESYMKRYLMEIEFINQCDISRADYLYALRSFSGIFYKLLSEIHGSGEAEDFKQLFLNTISQAVSSLKYQEDDFLDCLLLILTEEKARKKILHWSNRRKTLRLLKDRMLGR